MTTIIIGIAHRACDDIVFNILGNMFTSELVQVLW